MSNLGHEEYWKRLTAMSPADRLSISSQMTAQYKQMWLKNLRETYPTLSEEEFRIVVIGEMLKAGEEERQIAARIRARQGNASADVTAARTTES